MPVSVLFLCEFPSLLGGERSLLCFLKGCQGAVSSTVVAPEGGAFAKALMEISCHRLDWPLGGKQCVEALAMQCQQLAVQVVHANSLSTAEAALQLAEALSIPSIAHIRDIAQLSARKVDRLGQLSRLIAVSDATRAPLIQQGISANQVIRIYNGVDIDELRRQSCMGRLRRELSVEANTLLVGCVGQFCLRKGQDLFLEAAKLVSEQRPDIRYVLVGARFGSKAETVQFEQQLRQTSGRPPLANKVSFLGHREDWPLLVSDLDLLVVPSRQEPLSRALLEAMAMGVPAVATDVGGMKEILVDCRLGRLTPPDPQPIAKAILELIEKPRPRIGLASIGASLIESHFSLKRNVEQVLDVYRSVLAKPTS